MKTQVRDTSLDAYFTIRGLGIDISQAGRIYIYLKYVGTSQKGLTRNEIAEALNMRLSSVCARVNEMIGEWLSDSETRKCSISGKTSHVVRVKK